MEHKQFFEALESLETNNRLCIVDPESREVYEKRRFDLKLALLNHNAAMKREIEELALQVAALKKQRDAARELLADKAED